MKMKKFLGFMFGLVCILALSLFAACNGNTTDTQDKTDDEVRVVESLTVTNGASLTATKGDAPIQLSVKIRYAGETEKAATSADVTFGSSKQTTATVSVNGLITIVDAGSTTVTVESKEKDASGNKISKTVSLTVNEQPEPAPVVESLMVTNGASLTATKGDAPIQLSVKIRYAGETEKAATSADVTFGSSKQTTATVSVSGLITIVDAGSTTVTVESKEKNASGNKISKTVSLTVNEAPKPDPIVESLALTSAASYSVVYGLNDQFAVGDTVQIALNIKYVGESARVATSADVSFSSDNSAVATVDEDGLVTFVDVGTDCVITIKSKIEKQAGGFMEQTVNIEVKEPTPFPNIIVLSYRTTPDQYFLVKFKNTSTSNLVLRKYILVYCLDAAGKVLDKMVFHLSDGPYTGTVSPNYVTPDFIDKDHKLSPAEMATLMVIDNKDSIEDLVG
jgi:CxxC motif-containing protein